MRISTLKTPEEIARADVLFDAVSCFLSEPDPMAAVRRAIADRGLRRFRSKSAAARALGISRGAFDFWLAKGGKNEVHTV